MSQYHFVSDLPNQIRFNAPLISKAQKAVMMPEAYLYFPPKIPFTFLYLPSLPPTNLHPLLSFLNNLFLSFLFITFI